DIVVLLLVVGVAVFDACRDVVGHEGFRTDASRPAERIAIVLGTGVVLHFDIGGSKTGRAVEKNRVEVDTDAATERAVDALLGGQAGGAVVGVDARVVQVGFTAVNHLAVLHVVAAV